VSTILVGGAICSPEGPPEGAIDTPISEDQEQFLSGELALDRPQIWLPSNGTSGVP